VTREVRRRRAIVGVIVLALLAATGLVVALVSGGGDGGKLPPSAASPDRSREGREVIAASAGGAEASAAAARRAEARYPASVRRQVAKLSLRRQVAQLFAVGFDGYFPRAPFFDRLKRFDWGVVVLERRNFQSEGQIASLAGEPGAVAADNKLIAPIVAAPQIGGEDASAFPGLGPTAPTDVGSAKRAHDEAKAAADRLRGLGLTMTLAPVGDIGDAAGPAATTAFSPDAGVEARLVGAAVRGYREGALIPAVGHFPGQGAASQDPQAGPATVGLSLEDLRARDLRPFRAATRAKAPVIVMSSALYAAYDGITPAVLLPEAHALLSSIGFEGVVMTDDLVGVQAATGAGIGEVAVSALRAGADLLYLSGGPGAQAAAANAVLAAVKQGDLTRGRVRASVLKLLDLKRRFKIG
jgi:beta-N-acetylhexosaminidase